MPKTMKASQAMRRLAKAALELADDIEMETIVPGRLAPFVLSDRGWTCANCVVGYLAAWAFPVEGQLGDYVHPSISYLDGVMALAFENGVRGKQAEALDMYLPEILIPVLRQNDIPDDGGKNTQTRPARIAKALRTASEQFLVAAEALKTQ